MPSVLLGAKMPSVLLGAKIPSALLGVKLAVNQPSITLFVGGVTTMRSLKWILLGIYLIVAGLALLGVHFGGNILDIIAGICAVGAGILFLIDR
jgi:hypothetical protein